jgi:hypothetical protein
MKRVFEFSLQLLCEIFLIVRRIQQIVTINVHRALCKVPNSCQILMELEVLSKDSRKIIKFHRNPSRGSPVVLCGRTDRQTDTTKLRVAFRNFCERALKSRTSCKKAKNCVYTPIRTCLLSSQGYLVWLSTGRRAVPCKLRTNEFYPVRGIISYLRNLWVTTKIVDCGRFLNLMAVMSVCR